MFKKSYQKVFIISKEDASNESLDKMNHFLADYQGHILLASLKNKDHIHYIVEYKR